MFCIEEEVQGLVGPYNGSGGATYSLNVVGRGMTLNQSDQWIHALIHGFIVTNLWKGSVTCTVSGNIRNLAMEKVASTVMFPCKYSSSGCLVTLLHSSKTDHEEMCEFRWVRPFVIAFHIHNAKSFIRDNMQGK